MALILSIETATSVCSIALHRHGKLLGQSELFLERSHSGMLTVLIEQLIQNTSFHLSDLEAIAVSKGPGSYTGLRIGIATAKGLCYGLGIPLIGINTLEGLVQQVMPHQILGQYFCPMLDARRMEVYCMLVDIESKVVLETTAMIIDENSFAKELTQGPIVFFGNGAMKCAEVIKGQNAIFLEHVQTSAMNIGAIAQQRYVAEKFEDVAYFEPYYLKEYRTIAPKQQVGL